MGTVEQAITAVRTGQAVILPTDTVYGLCADPDGREGMRRLYRLKQRPESQPVALLCSTLEGLFERVPELEGRSAAIASRLLPGPYTLVLPNPARRYSLLTGAYPDAIGVRVPTLDGAAAEVVGRLGAVAATSANLHGQPDPARLDDVPEQVRLACGAVLDGGTRPGTASTVLDFTGPEPVVVREGAAPAQEALERALAARR